MTLLKWARVIFRANLIRFTHCTEAGNSNVSYFKMKGTAKTKEMGLYSEVTVMYWFLCKFQPVCLWFFNLILYNSQFLLYSSEAGWDLSVCKRQSFQPTLTNKHMLIMKEIRGRSCSSLPLKKEARCITRGQIQDCGWVLIHCAPASLFLSPHYVTLCVFVCLLLLVLGQDNVGNLSSVQEGVA